MERLGKVINGRRCAILVHGASIQELEKRIGEFANKNICWISFNKFDIMQKYILDEINDKLSVVQDCCEVHYNNDYELQVRIPRIEEYFKKSSNSLLITTSEIILNWDRVGRLDLYTNNKSRILLYEKGEQYRVPNSLSLFLMYLGRYSCAKDIVLFGCDGFRGDTSDDKAVLNSYYKPKLQFTERLIGYKDGTKSSLVGECNPFDNEVHKMYNRFAWQNNILPPRVLNVSPITVFNSFPVLNYSEAKQVFNGEM